jgi:long-chain fatty acid transport protein
MKLWISRLLLTITSLAVSMLLATSAAAGGLYITEFGTPSQGTSGAGAGVLAEDASTAMHNPAGIMSLEPGKSHWMVTAMYVDPSMKFSNDTANSTVPTGAGSGNGGDAGVSALGGGLFWARPMNERVGLGFAFNSVSAAAMEYGNDSASGIPNVNNFAGRYWATEVDLLTANLTPSVSWRINEQWSLGFSVPVQVGQLDLDVAVPLLPNPANLPATDATASISDGSDVSATIGVSVLWEVTDRVRLGAAYLGENELNFNGDLKVTDPLGNPVTLPVNSADVTIPFVQTVRLWGSTDIGEHVTLLATLAWEDWSSFKNLLIATDAGTGAVERDWKDTWKVGLGMRWRTGGAWSHYTGIAYDSSPTSASKRTTDMPMDEQWRLSAGTKFAFQNGMTLGGVLTYADYGKAKINNGSELWGNVVGEYSTNRIIFLGANFGF